MQTFEGRDAQWVAGFSQGVIAVMRAAQQSEKKSFAPGGVINLCNEVLMTELGTVAPVPKGPQRTMATNAPRVVPKQRSKSPKPAPKVVKAEIPKKEKQPIKGTKKCSKEPIKFPEPEPEEEEAQYETSE